MTATKETVARRHTFAIGRQTGDLASRVGILRRVNSPRIPQLLRGLIENHGDVALTFEVRQGVPPIGAVTFTSVQAADGENVVINDGINPAVTFEFDSNNSVTETNTLRKVVIGATFAETAGNFFAAVNRAPVFNIRASMRVLNNKGTDPIVVDLVNRQPGTGGNVAITTTANPEVTVSGMAGGTGGVHNVLNVAGSSVASLTCVPRGRVEFDVVLVLADLEYLTFNAAGASLGLNDDLLGELTISYTTGDLELATNYV